MSGSFLSKSPSDHSGGECRFCSTPLAHSVVDLGTSPLCQKHIKPECLRKPELVFPLHVYICGQCWLMQLEEFASPEEIFAEEYAYFSSYSDSWLRHAQRYTRLMIERFGLGKDSLAVEIASNDGYLLQYFVESNIPVLGVEPAANVAEAAREKGVRTEVQFFGLSAALRLSAQYGKASLLLGNNVLAHVPDINDFVAGIKAMLAEKGVLTMEFPHLQRLIEGNQFDTIYHEHFSYLSFVAANRIFAHHGITLFDVEELPTHGGSLRIYGRHTEDDTRPVNEKVGALLQRERSLGTESLEYYAGFEERVKTSKQKLLEFLIGAKRAGKTVAGYGAPGKGNTLLNYCGIRTDFLDFTVDRNPHKQGNFLPGTRIPIYHPDKIRAARPDYVLILPWNLQKEISRQLSYIEEWGGKFVIPIPEVQVLESPALQEIV
ncbi:MAG: methyltransferase domain-containing protein [Phaeodactylibacter sp.]|nr:methyltransferase domain-containing protein [Phaeodactylibacter sp.]